MYRIRRFGIIRTANVVALMYAIVIAIIFVPIAIIVAVAGTGSGASGLGAVGAVGVLILGVLALIAYTIVGWIFTAIACAVYNISARWIGGIEVHVDQTAAPLPSTQPAWGPPPGPSPSPSPGPSPAPPSG